MARLAVHYPLLPRPYADPREGLAAIAVSQGHTLTALSRMLSRRPGYLRDFVVHGRPKALTPRDHRLLSDMLGVEVGIRDLWDRDAWPS